MPKATEAHTLLNELMQTLTDRGRSILGRVRNRAENIDLVDLAELLLSRRGEASGVVLARTLLDAYEHASAAARLDFLKALADRFGPNQGRLRAAIQGYQRGSSAASMQALQAATESRRQELFRRLNLAPGGTFALVRMRAELLGHLKDHADLAVVDADFTHLFSSWFNRGFLEMRPIRWSTAADILEKIIRYEAVHPLSSWSDLKSRLEPRDRRCFAFFHPQLANEPLIFVEVALTTGIPAAVGPLLEQGRAPLAVEAATTAIFYSISNTQRGLSGVSFGHFLIKQVAEDLKREMPSLKHFVTLSPVPGFAAWLKRERQAPGTKLLDADVRRQLAVLEERRWFENEEVRTRVEQLLVPIAAFYFLKAKTSSGRPIDPVARFHLGNGARLERVNFLADVSDRGMQQAHGLMVNYVYDLGTIEQNHEAYAESGDIVASSAIRKASKGPTFRELLPIGSSDPIEAAIGEL